MPSSDLQRESSHSTWRMIEKQLAYQEHKTETIGGPIDDNRVPRAASLSQSRQGKKANRKGVGVDGSIQLFNRGIQAGHHLRNHGQLVANPSPHSQKIQALFLVSLSLLYQWLF